MSLLIESNDFIVLLNMILNLLIVIWNDYEKRNR